ncbi:MAG: CHAT domain-containing protein [Rhodospirillaceae bacterium]|nr:CHAT domain-containing protein [Rhodospirillaceae bacterium]
MTAKKRLPSRKPAVARAATIGLSENSGWTLRRSSADIRKDPFAAALADTGKLSILDSAVLAVDPARRMTGAEPHASLDIQIHRRAGDAYVLMVRHQSGAIDFRLPEDGDTRRGRNGGGGTLRFSVPLPAEGSGGRRGPVTKVIKTYLLKVTGVLADKMMPTLGRAWEQNRWKRAGRAEGLKEFAALTASGKELQPVARKSRISTDPAKPNLLLIHGTFSDGLGGFSDLVETLGSDGRTFMEAAASIYGDRTFVFDHFTVSKTPEENARALLAELPDGATLDVITHSRGALVLRALASPGIPDALKRRIRIRRAVLVAGPNQGTPLASPDRFDRLLTWLSNLMDLFPANPFTEGVSFIAEGLAWVAHRVVGALPGLSAMDPKRLASSGAMLPRDVEISAIASNFEAPASLLQRFADVGVDFFFNQANDLVVPTEGGWRFGPLADDAVPGPRIGCFGRGGNMAGEALSHISFFSRPATVDFLCRALRGESHALAILEPGTDLPYLTRRGAGALLEGSMTSPPLATPLSPPPATAIDLARPQHKPQDESTDEIFYLSILSTDANATQKEPVQQEDQKKAGSGKKKKEPPLLLVATFRNAQAIEPFHISGGDAGRRFYEIITAQREIEAYINGERADSVLPHAHALIALGCTLFETLLPGNVRRLYDVARAEQKNRRVNIMFTSQIGWIANLPWEFIYDPARKTFLAASEINFTRNVITGVPGDRFPELSTQLRILVVVAQPLGLAYLGHDQEREVILTGFKRLIDANLARVTVLLDATPDMLHQELETSQHDILHFIGHGEYNQRTDTACLVFENQTGGIQKIEASVLQQIVCRRNIRLVFLNACETGKGGLADFNRGIAPALVEAGVPAVIGNQYSVLDVSATAFARHLYWMLAKGRTIGDATREARVAVN